MKKSVRDGWKVTPMVKHSASSVWQITVRLTGVMPVVWRAILVRPATKLVMLHRYLQAAMGWQDYYLFQFTIGGRTYAIPNREWQGEEKCYDARRYTLERLFPSLPARFDYLYDFGDYWEHVVDIEGVEPAEYRKQYPICIAGAEACPPEDCGGPDGYRRLLAALNNPSHPEHADLTRWAASQYYDPQFHPQTATWRMRDMQRGYI